MTRSDCFVHVVDGWALWLIRYPGGWNYIWHCERDKYGTLASGWAHGDRGHALEVAEGARLLALMRGK